MPRSIEQLVSARSLKAAYAAMRSGSRVTIDLSPLRAPLARELKARAREHLGRLSQAQLAIVDRSVALELQRIQASVIEKVRDDIKDARQADTKAEGRVIVQDALQRAGVYGDNPYVLNTLLTTFNSIIEGEQTEQQARREDAWGFRYEKNTERHAALHNTTLPIDDPFWNRYSPPNGYGCKCKRVIIYTPAISYKPASSVTTGLVDKEFHFKPKFLHLDD